MPRKIKAVEVNEQMWATFKGVASIAGKKIPEAVEEALNLYIQKNKPSFTEEDSNAK